MKVRKDGIVETQNVDVTSNSVGLSTEAKQDTAITELNSLVAKDYSTQTTLAAVLAKIIAAPSTEAKQDTIITALSDLETELALKADLTETQPVSAASLPLPSGAATQTTLAAVLAKIIAAPSTEAKQDTMLTRLNTLITEQLNQGLSLDALTTHLTTKVSSLTNVSASATVVTLLASTDGRLGAVFYNDSTSYAYIKLGSGASTTSFTVKVAPGGTFIMEPFVMYGDIVTGIWDSATGTMRITELTE